MNKPKALNRVEAERKAAYMISSVTHKQHVGAEVLADVGAEVLADFAVVLADFLL